MNARNLAASAAALSVCLVPTANAELVFGVTDTQSLVSWDSTSPGSIESGVAISGLASNERIHAIDFRPATGQLYALGRFSNLYTIDTASGAASLVGGGPFGPALNGSSFGFDFNPTIDRIRVVGDADQNLVLNPDTGSSTQVTDLFYAGGDPNQGVDPNVVGSAYTNSVAGAMSTQLYGIDTALDALVRQDNSNGTLETVGLLGIDVNDTLTFDISGPSGVAYATIQDSGVARSTFWTIDLATGQAMGLGEIGGGAVITAMAVAPAPSTAGVLGLALACATRRRR